LILIRPNHPKNVLRLRSDNNAETPAGANQLAL
jgi:hypothetical protein